MKGGKNVEKNDSLLAHEVVTRLRACGRFLYYRMGGRPGRQRILAILSRRRSVLQKDLQEILQIQSGSLSEILIKLERDGLIEKVRSQEDGRQMTLRLTQAGEAEDGRLREQYDRKVTNMMDCLSQEELQDLNRLLERMYLHWIQIEEADAK